MTKPLAFLLAAALVLAACGINGEPETPAAKTARASLAATA